MSVEKTNIPKVLVLGAIAPSPESARADRLQYDDLAKTVQDHKMYEYARLNEFWNAKEDSLEELEAAKQQAMQYMLMGSLALQRAATPEAKRFWSERYTQATSELYGLPEAELARQLWHKQETGGEGEELFAEAAEKVGAFLDEEYAPVYEALGLENPEEIIDSAGIADRFERGLKVLAEQYDPDWAEWNVERDDKKDSLSVVAKDKKVIVGMRRASAASSQLKGLFSHEVLVHGLRAVNGSKVSTELGNGLPGYLDAEEGLGVFVEYAVNGKISEKNVDRYVDIAYALGVIDGQEHSRQELLDHAMARAKKRNEIVANKKSVADLEKEIYAHVNRIYRGSLGNEQIGVFTKDISYHKGFVEIGRFISEKIDEGCSAEKVMSYLTQGKFNPTEPLHRQVVGELKV